MADVGGTRGRVTAIALALAAAASMATATSARPVSARPSAPPVAGAPVTAACTVAGPEYYAIPLVTTRNVPGTGLGRGTAEVMTPPSSPYPVALASDGSYHYRVEVGLERIKVPDHGRLVAWVATRELDDVRRLGALDHELRAAGSVAWNKFIVVITLEPDDDPARSMWTGPIVFRGMSRSGKMHTMVGHGALQQENCAAYGY